jgi:Flp pilus assembly protein TadG
MSLRFDDAAENAAMSEEHTTQPRRFALRARRLRWRRDERGSVAVEFAIIAPIFFFLMFVIAETALVFIAEQVMDNAVFETARLIRTGQVQAAAMSKADFTTQVCNRMSVFVNCSGSNFYLDVKAYPTFASMDTSNPLNADETFKDAGAFAFGSANDIIVVRAYYQWPTNKIFGSLSLKNLTNGKRLIGSFAAFKNEPFSATASN